MAAITAMTCAQLHPVRNSRRSLFQALGDSSGQDRERLAKLCYRSGPFCDGTHLAGRVQDVPRLRSSCVKLCQPPRASLGCFDAIAFTARQEELLGSRTLDLFLEQQAQTGNIGKGLWDRELILRPKSRSSDLVHGSINVKAIRRVNLADQAVSSICGSQADFKRAAASRMVLENVERNVLYCPPFVGNNLLKVCSHRRRIQNPGESGNSRIADGI